MTNANWEKENIKTEKDINTLKAGSVNRNPSNENELKNLEENYKSSEGYLNHNADHMNKNDLEALKDRQENRRDQMNILK